MTGAAAPDDSPASSEILTWPATDVFDEPNALARTFASASTTIDQETIRLIRIQSDVSDATIHCESQIVSLHAGTEYSALSYHWGSQLAENKIILDGRSHLVSTNLMRFLRRARHLQDEFSGLLWIDALCIDQTNLLEKSNQVQIMAKIYSQARRVIVWLGPEYGDSNRAMETMALKADLRNPKWYRRIQSSAAHPAIRALCERPYWRRLWAVQELRTARTAHLMCGSMIVTIESLHSLLSLCATATGSVKPFQKPDTLLDSPAANVLTELCSTSLESSLWSLLLSTSHLWCANPLDRVYALLGLATSGHEDINPDYQRLLPDLLEDVLSLKFDCTLLTSAGEIEDYRKELQSTFKLSYEDDVFWEGLTKRPMVRKRLVLPKTMSYSSDRGGLSGRSTTPWDVRKGQDAAPNLSYDDNEGLIQSVSRRHLQQLIDQGAVESLRDFLEKDFDIIARNDFQWLGELVEVGCGYDEIAALLVDAECQNPWLYYEPSKMSAVNLSARMHHGDCIHNVLQYGGRLSTDHEALVRCQTKFVADPIDLLKLSGPRHISYADLDVLKHCVQEYCGLGGVIPSCRSSSEWDGKVTFQTADNCINAIVSYYTGTERDTSGQRLIARLCRVLERTCHAFALIQANGLCCSSFTIPGWTGDASVGNDVELRKISSEQVLELYVCLKRMQAEDMIPLRELEELEAVTHCLVDAALGVDVKNRRPIGKGMNQLQWCLHLASLAIQIVSLGLISYIFAHTGKFHPFFLMEPLDKITLIGSQSEESHDIFAILEPTQLTCLGNMTQGPMFVFRSALLASPASAATQHNLYASPEDVVNAWGSASLVTNQTLAQNGCVLGIEIGGGMLIATGNAAGMLHWERQQQDVDSGSRLPQIPYRLKSKALIGMVKVNNACPMSERDAEKEVRRKSSCHLSLLGTTHDRWVSKTRQFGFQGGQYLLLNAGIGLEKREGVAAKKKILQDLQSEHPRLCFEDLEAFFGVQISMCTGVARRVPLRLLLADVLQAYMGSQMLCPTGWESLEPELVEALRGPGFRKWFLDLKSRDAQISIVKSLGDLLLHLADTGIDDGNRLCIAWISTGAKSGCIKIDCDDRNFWARILKDTAHCATFACLTRTCLEEGGHCCQGPVPNGWRGTSELLSTEVCQHSGDDAQSSHRPYQTFDLKDKGRYRIGPPEFGLLATVSSPTSSTVPSLVISTAWMASVPEDIQKRLLRKLRAPLQCIRERGAIDGQSVTVCISGKRK